MLTKLLKDEIKSKPHQDNTIRINCRLLSPDRPTWLLSSPVPVLPRTGSPPTSTSRSLKHTQIPHHHGPYPPTSMSVTTARSMPHPIFAKSSTILIGTYPVTASGPSAGTRSAVSSPQGPPTRPFVSVSRASHLTPVAGRANFL